MRIRSPTIYQADQDELATIVLSAISDKDPAIRDEQITLVLMDVVHGIQLIPVTIRPMLNRDKMLCSPP